MSRERRHRPTLHPLTPAVAFLLLLAGTFWTPAWSDDRELLRASSGKPYVFFLLDTSGSMNEEPETGNPEALAAGDDSRSKLYQAKEALYEVLTDPSFEDKFLYGFSTFNQDTLRALRKHWIYRPTTAPVWTGTTPLSFPVKDQGYAFGGGTNSIQYRCTGPTTVPATGANLRSLTGYPRTGDAGDQVSGVWLKQSGALGRTFYVETKISSGSLGDATIQVQHTRKRLTTGTNKCGLTPPSSTTFDTADTQTITLTYALVTDAVLNDQINDKIGANTCNGLDPNSDSSSDLYSIPSEMTDVNLKYPTTPNTDFPALRSFDRGDFLPWDWTRNNRDEILARLAPNLRDGEAVPDFRVARYFKDFPKGDIGAGTQALELHDEDLQPLVGEGFTPLGYSLDQIRTWYENWQGTANGNDLSWSCRRKFLIVLTDGNETCDPLANNTTAVACVAAKTLYDTDKVTTFVIAFGVDSASAGNVLTCIARNGGTTAPVYPANKADLIDKLKEALKEAILESTRTFASAAVPAVQAEVQDKIFLTNFTPIEKKAYWDGHVDAYLKPLPLTDPPNRQPDDSLARACGTNRTSECHLWDAGDKIQLLAPTDAEVDAATPNFHIGNADNQRRVFYTKASSGDTVPLARNLLKVPSASDEADLWAGFGLTSATSAAKRTELLGILRDTYRIKSATVKPPGKQPKDITYLLGDIFHSNPILLSTPDRARYFTQNFKNDGKTCAQGDRGYRCFANKHQRRRKMLLVGSNDQQLHIFDAGIFRKDGSNLEDGEFDNGTGFEIYSYVPRPLLKNLKALADVTTTPPDPTAFQLWGVDGTLQVDDVFIDPSHTGTPNADDRQWRTIGVGGLREGGESYYALDLTQPDTLDADGVPQPDSDWVPSCWNGGSSCGPVPFGAVLWSFTDTSNEDSFGGSDLGQTWSSPNTGLVRVRVGVNTFEDKFVAVFGGGMDPENLNKRGNWLYMVDVETGKAIYKKQLEGSAPSDPAAVDTDQDGYLDTIYIGTTAGYLYKVDLKTPALLEANAARGGRLDITSSEWDPFKIFDTVQSDGRRGPIYFAPSVIFVAQLGRYALAFGTGNRFDLWAKDGIPGRFYVILDNGFATGMTPMTELDYTDITTEPNPGANYLLRASGAGWFRQLNDDQRMITKPFTIAGISIFTAYNPRPDVVEDGEICSRAGETRIFTLYTTSGDRVDTNVSIDGDPQPDFVTNPFVESSSTKNKPCDEVADPTCLPRSVPICENRTEVTQRLMELFPDNCQFANATQNIETIQSNNGLVCIAPVPICVARKNWKEN